MAKNMAEAEWIMQMEINTMVYGSMISKQDKVSVLWQMAIVMSRVVRE